MPNGGPGDHPLTDMLLHGKHPFPADVEAMLREVLALDPIFPDGQRPLRGAGRVVAAILRLGARSEPR